jgi:hypothetical protein
MQLADRIEKRRFVGREFLLWLWFESEMFEGTLATREHGEFGFWVEKNIALSAGREATKITGAQPAWGREAKESLRRGKLPEAASFHLVQGDRESTFALKAEQLGIASLKLPTVLGVLGADEDAAPVLDVPVRRPKRKKETRAQQERRQSDDEHEAFYERMHLTRGIEELLEALYRDFLALRLGEGWAGVASAMGAWAAGEELDADGYRRLRDGAIARGGKRGGPSRKMASAPGSRASTA